MSEQIIEKKRCKLCGEEKLLNEFYGKEKKLSYCIPCHKRYTTERGRPNESAEARKHRLDYLREYYEGNKDAALAYSREYVADNKEKTAGYQREYAAANQPRVIQHKKKWWDNPTNRDQSKLRAREHRRATKLEVFTHYGGAICGCCGETEIDLLSLDHKFNDGNSHRKQMKEHTGEKAYRWARTNNWPDVFQVLCLSCNIGKHINGGECPHETTRRRLLKLVA